MEAYFDSESGEFYCEVCCDDNYEEEFITKDETDTPVNCTSCHGPLDFPLTPEGVQYVIETARGALELGPTEYLKVYSCYTGTFYENCPHVDIVLDWIKDIQNYTGLSEEDETFISKFIEAVEESKTLFKTAVVYFDNFSYFATGPNSPIDVFMKEKQILHENHRKNILLESKRIMDNEEIFWTEGIRNGKNHKLALFNFYRFITDMPIQTIFV